jgi:hypothetical protein
MSFGLDAHDELHRLKAEKSPDVFEGSVHGQPGRERSSDVEAAVNAGAREFETAVQAGVAALLNVAARKIQEHAARASDPGRSDPYKRRR